MLSLKIALRYLFSRKSHSAVNVISAVAVGGVAVAVMAMVAVMSVFNGFTDLAASRFSLLDPALRVVPREGKVISDADSLIAALSSIQGVEAAVPVVTEQGLAVLGDRQMPVTLKGVDTRWQEVTEIDSTIIDGQYMGHLPLDSMGATMATVSVGVAVDLGARPDYYRRVEVYLPKRAGRINPANPMAAFRTDSLMVSGVFQVHQAELDKDLVVMPIDALRAMLAYDTEASAIEIALTHGASPARVQAQIDKQFPAVKALDRMAQQQEAFRMIEIEKWISFLMLAFILVIASFNIISTLSMLVIEKQESIAVLRALGASTRMVRRIFVIEGWLVSMIGGLIGAMAGVVLVLAQQWGHFIKLGGDHSRMTIDYYPVRLVPADLLVVAGIVIAVGVATGLITMLNKSLSQR